MKTQAIRSFSIQGGVTIMANNTQIADLRKSIEQTIGYTLTHQQDISFVSKTEFNVIFKECQLKIYKQFYNSALKNNSVIIPEQNRKNIFQAIDNSPKIISDQASKTLKDELSHKINFDKLWNIISILLSILTFIWNEYSSYRQEQSTKQLIDTIENAFQQIQYSEQSEIDFLQELCNTLAEFNAIVPDVDNLEVQSE